MPYIPPKSLPPGTTPNLQPIRYKMPEVASTTSHDSLATDAQPQLPSDTLGDGMDNEIVAQLAVTHLSPAPIDPPPPPASTSTAVPMHTPSAAGNVTPSSTRTSQSSADDGLAMSQDSSAPPTDSEDNPIAKYREQLYTYTRNLYLEAKLSKERKENRAQYSQFGYKQSGMERMAAKKALARRLNE